MHTMVEKEKYLDKNEDNTHQKTTKSCIDNAMHKTIGSNCTIITYNKNLLYTIYSAQP